MRNACPAPLTATNAPVYPFNPQQNMALGQSRQTAMETPTNSTLRISICCGF